MPRVQVVNQLTQIEKVLLVSQLEDLHKVLEPGILVLNWHSLNIPAFVISVRKVSGPVQETSHALCKVQLRRIILTHLHDVCRH